MNIKRITLSALEIFKLKDNPFSATPVIKEKKVIWAGRSTIKEEIQSIISTSFLSSPSRITVCWGEWGTGKTHSMRYFSQTDILDEISSSFTTKKGLSIPIVCPRESIHESLYISIIKDIGLEKIKEIIFSVAIGEPTLTHPSAQISKIQETGFSETTAKIFQGLIHGDPNHRACAERYLFLEASLADIKKLNVPRRIKTKNEQTEFLSKIFKMLLNEKSQYSRIFLWLDEMEHIDNFSGKDLLDLRSILRSLIDMIPSGLTIILNGTFRVAEDFSSFLNYLGPAIRDRIYKAVPLPPLEKTDIKVYVSTLLNHELYRNTEDKTLLESEDQIYYPFDEECIDYLFEKLISNLKRNPTPRNLNDALTITMELFISDAENVRKMKESSLTINSEFIDSEWDKIKIRFTDIL